MFTAVKISIVTNALVESYRDGQQNSILTGKEEIETAFTQFLNQFDTDEHKNGDHRVEINGKTATGYGDCKVTLVNNTTRLEWTVHYTDIYTFEGEKWLIQKRTSTFE